MVCHSLSSMYICKEYTHLWSLIKERVPYFEKDVTDNTVHKYHQKPVEGDEGIVHFVLLKMGVQSRQLLTHEVSEHPLVHLEREQRGERSGVCKPQQLLHREQRAEPTGTCNNTALSDVHMGHILEPGCSVVQGQLTSNAAGTLSGTLLMG